MQRQKQGGPSRDPWCRNGSWCAIPSTGHLTHPDTHSRHTNYNIQTTTAIPPPLPKLFIDPAHNPCQTSGHHHAKGVHSTLGSLPFPSFFPPCWHYSSSHALVRSSSGVRRMSDTRLDTRPSWWTGQPLCMLYASYPHTCAQKYCFPQMSKNYYSMLT